MKKLRPNTVAIIVTVLVLIAAGSYLALKRQDAPVSQNNPAAVRQIGPGQLADMLGNKDFLLINAHTPYEGEIAKTDLFIPYTDIDANARKLPDSKSAKIVVYCRTGSMSKIAAQTLVSLGYKTIYDLSGGMEGWQTSGNKIIQNETRR